MALVVGRTGACITESQPERFILQSTVNCSFPHDPFPAKAQTSDACALKSQLGFSFPRHLVAWVYSAEVMWNVFPFSLRCLLEVYPYPWALSSGALLPRIPCSPEQSLSVIHWHVSKNTGKYQVVKLSIYSLSVTKCDLLQNLLTC